MATDPSWRALIGWLEDPAQDKGIYFSDHAEWVLNPYANLARRAERIAWWLRHGGIGPGDVVIVVQANTPEFIGSFFGSLLAGAIPAPVAPAESFKHDTEFAGFLGRVLRITRARAVLAEPVSAAAAQAEIAAAGCLLDDGGPDCGDGADGDISGDLGGVPRRDPAFLQFSSGSQGLPRAVRVSYSAVSADATAIMTWLGASAADDSLATWLPVHHDMGLIGCCLMPCMYQLNVWMMQPAEFIRSPRRWLSCFGEQGATVGVMPNFGLRHILRRVRPQMLEGMDFSRWRALIVGAERVDREVVDAVTRLLAPAGFRSQAMAPAYGMAETALAVAGSSPSEYVHSVSVDAGRLVPGEPIAVTKDDRSGSCVGLVSCGRPLPGIGVAIVDDDGIELAEGTLGRVQVHGSVVTDGYLISEEDDLASQEPFHGVFTTGDMGFILGGELYVVGRTGDSIKSLGRWLYAEDVEDVVARAVSAEHRPVVVLGSMAGSSTALVLVDRRVADQAEKIGRAVTDNFAELRTLVLVVTSGEIPRTTSRKPRRPAAWRALATHDVAERAAWDSATVPVKEARGSGADAEIGHGAE
jgi:acyl-CoA synthetase (AMP-forming)/AMP-acid ligase II